MDFPTVKITELTRLNPKIIDDWCSNLTKSIYEKAYATTRQNPLILTEEFGLDGAGQQFVDHFLTILEGLREQKFLLPPDDRVSETGIRNALGAR